MWLFGRERYLRCVREKRNTSKAKSYRSTRGERDPSSPSGLWRDKVTRRHVVHQSRRRSRRLKRTEKPGGEDRDDPTLLQERDVHERECCRAGECVVRFGTPMTLGHQNPTVAPPGSRSWRPVSSAIMPVSATGRQRTNTPLDSPIYGTIRRQTSNARLRIRTSLYKIPLRMSCRRLAR